MTDNVGKSEGAVTFINVFEIAREDLEGFKAGWVRLAEVMASAPGFRGARLHEAISGDTRFQLVNIAHWDSEQAWRDAAANPEMQAAVAQVVGDPAQRAAVHNPGLYRPVVAFGDEA